MKNEAILLIFLIQLLVIIGIARIASYVSRLVAQPIVVGEIMAGLILGPSFLGKLFPKAFHSLFPDSTAQIIYILSQIGLVFLMFIIGLEFDFANIRKHGRTAGLVSLSGIVLPFGLGLLLGKWMHGYFPSTNELAFCLFIATAISITAIPILGRIMLEFNLHRTELGMLTITAAAIDDALGWICLAVVSAIVAAHLNGLVVLRMILEVALLALIMMRVIRPLAIRFIGRMMATNGGSLSLNALAVLISGVFLCAIVTNWIGISSLFGPFMMGACLFDQEAFRDAVFQRLKDFITVFFLPIFFTYTGLHTDMGTLGAGFMWVILGMLLFVSFFGKFVGCFFAAKLSGLKNKQAAAVGIMMNTRALMGLIAANIGMEMGAITKEVYCMLVLMCALSTIVASPVLRRLIPGTELEEPFMKSEYIDSRRKLRFGRRAEATEAAI